MPFIYHCLLDWNEQIWVSHVQFKIPPVSSRGVTSRLPSRWNRHSAGHRVVAKPCHLCSSARLDPVCNGFLRLTSGVTPAAS